MLWNYLKLFYRHAARHKVYTIINIVGLAVGLSCCFLIFLYAQDELKADRFNANYDRIYRVNFGRRANGEVTNANTSFSPGPALAAQFPEVEQMARFRMMGWGESRVARVGDNSFYEENFMLADPAVFKIFSFPFIAGDSATALIRPHTIVLTESTALKYFHATDPIGQTISVDVLNDGNFIPFEVTGVMKDIPYQSHIRPDFLASFNSLKDADREAWGLDPIWTYVLLKKGTDPKALAEKFNKLVIEKRGDDYSAFYVLQPMRDIWFASHLRAKPGLSGRREYILVFSAIALFVLILAGINFVNLATARSVRRAREIGLRKVWGAQRAQLIRQFLVESVLQAFVAMLVGAGLVELGLPILNGLTDKHLSSGYLHNFALVASVFGLTLLVGLVAGMYPAFVLSLFRPVHALKVGATGIAGRVNTLRRSLIVLQLTVAIVLMVGTLVTLRQMNHVQTMSLGFDRDQILVLPFNDNIRKHFDAFKTELSAQPGVLDLSGAEQVPGRAGNGAGYMIDGVDQEMQGAYRLLVDDEFVRTYGLNVVAGRDFRPDEPLENENTAYIVNEEFAREEGLKASDLIGKQLTMYHAGTHRKGPIIGVVNDFNIFSLHSEISSYILSVWPKDHFGFLSVRVDPTKIKSIMSTVPEIWNKYAPQYPFDYYFLDQDFDRLHRRDSRFAQLVTYFALLALFVACLGLFGLTSFSAAQRTREISIRKVLGASSTGMTMMMLKEMLWLVLTANVIAWPIALYATDRWLDDFVYRVQVGVGLLALAGIAALFVTLLATAHQALRAARTNPAQALRYE